VTSGCLSVGLAYTLGRRGAVGILVPAFFKPGESHMVTIMRLRRKPTAAGERALAQDNSAALDKAWFQRNPHRQYRARLATLEEMNKLTACNAMPRPMPANMQVWTCVKQIFPGYRERHYRSAAVPPWMTHDVPEHIARMFFESKEDREEISE
jgi:hypothetical protein